MKIFSNLIFCICCPGWMLSFADDAPPNSVDHAGIMQSWEVVDYEVGKEIYRNLCTNCHGADGITSPLPTAPAFGASELKYGADPYAMFLTLTHGNGLMGPQTWMTPEERYAVIHYIREAFMRPQRSDFVELNDGYLEALPTVEVTATDAEKKDRDFGPALASQLGREHSSVLSVRLDQNTTISYDLHSMDLAGIWRGGFLNLKSTQHVRERGGGVAEREGTPLQELTGWRWGHEGTLSYSREGLLPRGPLPSAWMDYHGHYLYEDKVVLSYAIDGREIRELPILSGRFPAVEQTLRIGPGARLILAVGAVKNASSLHSGQLSLQANQLKFGGSGDLAVVGASIEGEAQLFGRFMGATVRGDIDGLNWDWSDQGELVLEIPADQQERLIQVVRCAGTGEGELFSFANFLRSRTREGLALPDPGSLLAGGSQRWAEILESVGALGDSNRAYTLDTIGLPPDEEGNPYNVWFRTSAIAFFPDGRMVVTTHGGDVWIVTGVDDTLENLRWKRFAAGLYEPFGVLVIDDLIYVTGKDRLTRLHDINQDGEADFYESFSADDDVSTFFHAYNFDLQRDGEGNLYYAKSGQFTDYREPGAVIKVSPDGVTREVYCTGFRTPNGMGMLPDGRPTVSDNQGTWMPASKINIVERGGFYGYVQNKANPHWSPDGGAIDHTRVVPPPTFDQPVIWMPQDFDNSSGGQLYVDDPRWGPLAGRLLHTSFGKGWLYYLMLQDVAGTEQAAIVKFDLDAHTGIHRAQLNPADGQVYATGLNGWNGGGRKGLAQGGIHRFRYTGQSAKLLTDVQVTAKGIELEFNFQLSPDSAANLEGYQLEQWNYLWTENYGSEHYAVNDAWEAGKDRLEVDQAILGADGRSVLLVIPEIQPVNQVRLDLAVQAADGSPFTEQAYLTINAVPGGQHPTMKELTIARSRLTRELTDEKRLLTNRDSENIDE